MELGGRYEVGVRLAKGGFGEVFAGAAIGDFGFRRPVAIKVLEAPNPAELALAQRLQHPNIVEVLDVFAADGRVYLVMELADAGSLGDVLHAGPVTVSEAAYVADQVLAALVVAHASGVVAHRDVNPHNVLLWASGAVKLADFGIAKAEGVVGEERTKTGSVKGKLSYLAPEQVRQEPIDGRTDLWALGIMLYELVAGRRPFGRGDRSDSEFLVEIARAKRPDLQGLQLPAWFQGLLEGLLAPSIEDRWTSASAARVALAAAYREWSEGQGRLAARLQGQSEGRAVGEALPTRNVRPDGPDRATPPPPPALSEVFEAEVVEVMSAAPQVSRATRWPWALVGALSLVVVGLAGVLVGDRLAQRSSPSPRPAVITVEREIAPLEAPQTKAKPKRARKSARAKAQPEMRERPVLGPECFEPGGTLEVK